MEAVGAEVFIEAFICGASIWKLSGNPAIDIDLPNDNDPDSPGVKRERLALFNAASLISPLAKEIPLVV